MYRRPILAVWVAALVAMAVSAGAQTSKSTSSGSTKQTKSASLDPLVVGPTIYRLVLENDRVRVLEARFRPGVTIGPHTHPDHVVVVTSAGKLAITSSDGSTQELDAKVGDTFFIDAGTHSARNVGTTEFVCVVTELKGKYKAKGEASPKPGTIEVQQGKVDG